MSTALILFNRDLRVHDHPALSAAAKSERVVPVFCLDDAILGTRFAAPNRLALMLEALHDLGESLHPEPIVDHADAVAEVRARRGLD